MDFESWVDARLGVKKWTRRELAQALDTDPSLLSRAIAGADTDPAHELRARVKTALAGVRVDEPLDGETKVSKK